MFNIHFVTDIDIVVFALLYTLSAQLAEIRKISYAKVLCENADHLPMIQPKVLFHPLSVVTEIAKLVQHCCRLTTKLL